MIQVLQRAADVVEALASDDECTLASLCERTRMKKSTLATICAALCEIGFAEKTGLGVYALGPQLLGLATKRLLRNTMVGLAKATVDRIAGSVGEHAVVGVLRGRKVVYLAKAYPNASVVVNPQRVDTDSVYATACGRVLLAHVAAEQRRAAVHLLDEPGNEWPEAVASSLEAELAGIRDREVAYRTTADGHVLSIAVPVRVGKQGCVAAAGVALPTTRATPKHREHILEALRAAADEMAIRLAECVPATAQVGRKYTGHKEANR